MLMVLIHEGAIKNEKLKIGGKLSSLVKTHKEELQHLLGKEEETKPEEWVYVRLNKHLIEYVKFLRNSLSIGHWPCKNASEERWVQGKDSG